MFVFCFKIPWNFLPGQSCYPQISTVLLFTLQSSCHLFSFFALFHWLKLPVVSYINLALDFRSKSFSPSPLSMLAVGFCSWSLIKLKKSSFILIFLSVFILLIFVKGFFCIDDYDHVIFFCCC